MATTIFVLMMFLDYQGHNTGDIEVSHSEWETKQSCENAGNLAREAIERERFGARFIGYFCAPKNQELYMQQRKKVEF